MTKAKTRAELFGEINERTAQLNKATDEIGTLRAAVEGLKETVIAANERADGRGKIIRELTNKNEVLVRTASTAVHTATTDLRDRLTETERIVVTQRRRAETAEKESTTRAQERDVAQLALQNCRESGDRLAKQVDRLRNELAEANKDVAMKHGDVVELTKQRDNAQTDVKLICAQRDSWKEAAETATRRADDNEAWAKRAEARIKVLDAARVSLIDQRDTTINRCAAAERERDEALNNRGEWVTRKSYDEVVNRCVVAERQRDEEIARYNGVAERAEEMVRTAERERDDAIAYAKSNGSERRAEWDSLHAQRDSLRSSLSAQRKAGHDTGVSLAASAGDCERTHARLTDAEARVEHLETLLHNVASGMHVFTSALIKELPES